MRRYLPGLVPTSRPLGARCSAWRNFPRRDRTSAGDDALTVCTGVEQCHERADQDDRHRDPPAAGRRGARRCWVR
jgi:hypothetical protein